MHPKETGPLRMQEEINSARVVGVDTVDFLGYTDGVIEYSAGLRRDLSRAIRRYRPDVVLTINHHPQFFSGHANMADHRWVGLAVFDAARDAGNRWIFPELLDEGHEPWNEVRFVAVFGSTLIPHTWWTFPAIGKRVWIHCASTRCTWRISATLATARSNF